VCHPARRRVRSKCVLTSIATAADSEEGAAVALYIEGNQVGEGRLAATVPLIFSGDETTGLAQDTA
jgi:hypothetical protein